MTSSASRQQSGAAEPLNANVISGYTRHRAGFLGALVFLTVFLFAACGPFAEEQKSTNDSSIGLPPGVQLEQFFQKEGLDPVKLAFTPDGRLFYAKMGLDGTGEMRVIQGGLLLVKPFATFRVATCDGCGMTGLVVDPDYNLNRFIYASYIAPRSDNPNVPYSLRVVRLNDGGNVSTEEEVIIELPTTATCCRRGGDLAFGGDDKLYVSTGDTENVALVENLDFWEGKILRLNRDGTAPPDNPFFDPALPPSSPRNYVFAYGFRNVYDLAAATAKPFRLYGTEQGELGPDEVNLIQSGGNFGWPSHEGYNPAGYVGEHLDPVLTVAPPSPLLSGVLFYEGETLPPFQNRLLVCDLRTGLLRLFTLEPPTYSRATKESVLLKDLCLLDITVSPTGMVYFSDWKTIYRIVPSEFR